MRLVNDRFRAVVRSAGAASLIVFTAACGKPAISSPPSTITMTVTGAPPTTTTVAPSAHLFNLDHWHSVLDASTDVRPSGSWVYVAIGIRNISSGPQTFVADKQRLLDRQRREFIPDMRVTKLDPAGSIGAMREVNPGIFFPSWFYFDVPRGTLLTDYQLVLSDAAGVFATVQLDDGDH